MFPNALKTTLSKWRSQGPVSVSEIVTWSGMDINEFDADHIEIKREDKGNYYNYGMFDKTKNEMHGIVRYIEKNGTIFEGMF